MSHDGGGFSGHSGGGGHHGGHHGGGSGHHHHSADGSGFTLGWEQRSGRPAALAARMAFFALVFVLVAVAITVMSV